MLIKLRTRLQLQALYDAHVRILVVEVVPGSDDAPCAVDVPAFTADHGRDPRALAGAPTLHCCR